MGFEAGVDVVYRLRMEFVVSTLIASRTVDFISMAHRKPGTPEPRTLDYKELAITKQLAITNNWPLHSITQSLLSIEVG